MAETGREAAPVLFSLFQQLLAWPWWIIWALCLSPSHLDDNKATLCCFFSLPCFLPPFQTHQGHSCVASTASIPGVTQSHVRVMKIANVCLFHYKWFRARCTFHLHCRGYSLMPRLPPYKRQMQSMNAPPVFLAAEWKIDHLKEERTHSFMVHILRWYNTNIQIALITVSHSYIVLLQKTSDLSPYERITITVILCCC